MVCALLGPATGVFAAELPPINKVLDTAKTLNQDIQNKLNTAPVVKEIADQLPSKEQASGFLAGVWQIVWTVVKFIGKIFDFALKLIIGVITPILQKVGLGFFTN